MLKMFTKIEEFRAKLNENVFSSPNPDSEIYIIQKDYKESLDDNDYAIIKQKTANGKRELRELNVYTADAKIWVVAPESFFTWLDNNDQYGDAFELLFDADALYDDEENIQDTIVYFYMEGNELYVRTESGSNIPYSEWYAKLV